MKTLSKYLLISGLLMQSTSFALADEVTALNITLKDNSNVTCSFAQKPVMSLQDGKLTMTTEEADVKTWEFSEVKEWNFIKIEVNDINTPDTDNGFIIMDDAIIVNNDLSGNVCVYDLNGMQVLTMDPSNSQRITLSDLKTGTYILKAGNHAIKFQKR